MALYVLNNRVINQADAFLKKFDTIDAMLELEGNHILDFGKN
jgi:hypothetical protein